MTNFCQWTKLPFRSVAKKQPEHPQQIKTTNIHLFGVFGTVAHLHLHCSAR